jgi:tripartite-type tricarboxylate transporter receptor subunit TctC
VDKIQRAVAKVAADPDVSAKLNGFGISAVSTTPAEFDSYFRGEIVRRSKVFKESGIKLD